MIEKLMTVSRVTEIDAVSMRMIGAYKTTTLSTDSHLGSLFASLETSSGSLTSAINRSKAESNLEAKDEVRDTQVRAFFYLIQGFLHHPDTTISTAAQTVDKVFQKYGVSVTGENYATESSLLASLLEDLSKPKLQNAIALLSGCTEVLAALETAQNEFEAARVAYEQEKAEEGNQLNASAIKREVLGIINDKIVVYLRAMETVDAETYGAFARTIAIIISENNEVVKKRRKKTEEEPADSID